MYDKHQFESIVEEIEIEMIKFYSYYQYVIRTKIKVLELISSNWMLNTVVADY